MQDILGQYIYSCGQNPGLFLFTNLPQLTKNNYDELVVFNSFKGVHSVNQYQYTSSTKKLKINRLHLAIL